MKIIIENLIKEDLLMSSDLDLWTWWYTNGIVSLLLCYFNGDTFYEAVQSYSVFISQGSGMEFITNLKLKAWLSWQKFFH